MKKDCLVFAIVGAERLLRREALDRVLRQAGAESDPLGPSRFDGESAELVDVLDDLRTPSLLGDRRVVIVDDADELITKHRAALERYCADPSPSGVLVLLCDSMPKTTRLYKQIAATGELVFCEPPKGNQVGAWLTERAVGTYGKKLAGPAGSALRDHLGTDLGRLDAELSKLAAYVGQRDRIEVADVAECTGRLREERVFAVVDTMVAGDTAKALERWDQVMATDRAAPQRAIGGFAYSVRKWTQARRLKGRGGNPATVFTPIFVDHSLLQRGMRVTLNDWRDRVQDLLRADYGAKTSLGSVDLAIEKFIVKHSGGGGAA